MEQNKELTRWRMILGEDTQQDFESMQEGFSLTDRDIMMDTALAAIYGGEGSQNQMGGAGKGASSPHITKWMKDVRTLFDPELVKVIQQDAIERKGWKQLLMEPELLEQLEPDIEMASMLLTLKDMIPSKSKDQARAYIQKIVDIINNQISSDLKRSVHAALQKKEHSPLPSAAAIDFPYTIRKNLKHYSSDLQTIIPERVYFFDRKQKSNHWHVILDIDQSGSMSSSIMYSSVTACILASMNAVKTNVVAFDTTIMDLSDLCNDPVDLLYGFQLGGGTDIHKSVKYCEQLIEEPDKTIFFLISDLEEGGNHAGLLHRLQDIKDSGVLVVCLLAIQDGGKPYYSQDMAQKVANLGIPCFACAPEKLPELLHAVLQKQDLSQFMKN